MIDWLMQQLTSWFSTSLTQWMQLLLSSMGHSLLIVPDVTGVAQVDSLWSTMQVIANSCYVLILVVGAGIAMSHETLQSDYALKDMAPRMVFGFLAANLSFDWCHRIFVFAQALLDAVADGMLASVDLSSTIQAQVDAAMQNAPAGALLLMVIIVALCAFLVAALIFGWIIRIGVLLVLVGAAPIALACHGLAQTEAVARLWWRSFLGTLAIQVIQALVLLAGISVFLTPAAPITAQMGVTGGALMNLFVLVSLLWGAIRVPPTVRRLVLQSGGGNIGTHLVRAVVIRYLIRRR